MRPCVPKTVATRRPPHAPVRVTRPGGSETVPCALPQRPQFGSADAACELPAADRRRPAVALAVVALRDLGRMSADGIDDRWRCRGSHRGARLGCRRVWAGCGHGLWTISALGGPVWGVGLRGRHSQSSRDDVDHGNAVAAALLDGFERIRQAMLAGRRKSGALQRCRGGLIDGVGGQ